MLEKKEEQADYTLFQDLFESAPAIQYPKDNEVITGTIEKIEKKNILVNVNNQFTGLVISKELGNSVDFNGLQEGQKIDVMVLGDSVERGLLILSLKRANQIRSLEKLNSSHTHWDIITVRATEANKGWLLVDIDGLQWFIPVSQLTPMHYPRVEGADPEKILEHLKWLLSVDFKVRVINIDSVGKKIIFSEKAALEEERSKALETLKEGDIVEGTVSGILSYWLFVTFMGLEWLVHVSEIDWWHVTAPEKFAKVWMKVKVKIIGLDTDKISLSIKQLKDNPWDVLAKKIKEGDVIKAPISRISKFWAFMDLDGGIQGLIHLSEISYEVIKDIRDYIQVGQEVEAKVINFEPNKKRIGLSLKALEKMPEWMKEDSKPKIKEGLSEEDKIDAEMKEKKKTKTQSDQ